jgi:hypothetical protein
MKQQSRIKRRHSVVTQSVRINISLPPVLVQRTPELLNKYGFTGLSDYYQARMRKDLGLDLVS